MGDDEEAPTRAQKAELARLDHLQQLETFIKCNENALDDEALQLLRSMEMADQKRVMAVGTIRNCDDPSGVLKHRVKVAKENEALYQKAVKGEFQISHLVREAHEEEAEAWITANAECLDEIAINEFRNMTGKDKARVIAEGRLGDCQDPGAVILARAKRAREMENQVVEMMCKAQSKKGKTKVLKPPTDPALAAKLNDCFVQGYAKIKEVPKEESRFAPPAGAAPVLDPAEEAARKNAELIGNIRGIGGVVEMVKAKYGCQKGQRFKVVGESGGMGGLWKLEGNRTIPKPQVNDGWKWVMSQGDDPQKKPSKAAVPGGASPTPAASSPVAAEEAKASKKKDAEKPKEGKRKKDSDEESEKDKAKKAKKSKAKDDSDDDKAKKAKKSKAKDDSDDDRAKKAKKSKAKDDSDDESDDDRVKKAKKSRAKSESDDESEDDRDRRAKKTKGKVKARGRSPTPKGKAKSKKGKAKERSRSRDSEVSEEPPPKKGKNKGKPKRGRSPSESEEDSEPQPKGKKAKRRRKDSDSESVSRSRSRRRR